MKTLLTSSKWRWFASLMVITLITVTGFFLSNAFARQMRVAPSTRAVQRTATHIAASAFTFSPPIQLIRPASPIFFQQGGEPEIAIDKFGDIYVTAIQGVPGGVDLWKSIDKGASFVYLGEPDGAQDKCATLPQCAGLGGGDDQIDVSPGGYLYVSSLWLGNVTMSTSTDGGTGGTSPGQKWEVHPAAAGLPSDDRQWVAAYGPETINMVYNNTALTDPPGGIGLFFVKSTDGGKTFGAPVEITTPTALNSVNVQGNLVADPFNGNLYTVFIPQGSLNIIRLASSTDGGATWTTTTAYNGPGGTDARGVFPILAVDRGGNLHLVFTSVNTATRACHIMLTSTSNPAAATPTWLPAVQVDSGSGNTTTAVEPWIVAGSPGIVDVTWLGTAAATPDSPSNWRVFFAQTTNALSGSPLFNEIQVTPNPVHDHSICFNGGGCASAGTPGGEPENRDMAEYYRMTLDNEGNANISYPDSVTNCPAANCVTNAWFTKQVGGTSAYAPPASPAGATFSASITIPASGGTGEPNMYVDTHNCIYGGSIGGPIFFTSKDNGNSFTTKTVALGSGVHGGDAAIITAPKLDLTRPDQVYTADLGISTVHIGKSTDGGNTYFQPGTGGAAGEVAPSSDRMWFSWDRTGGNDFLYLTDHEFSSETVRMWVSANDMPWTGITEMTDPELLMTQNANTNPGPAFVDKATHTVYSVFDSSTNAENSMNPPFGKLLNVWLATGAAPAAAGSPPGPFTNQRVYFGLYDSPNTLPPPAAPPPGTLTYGTSVANIFPVADIDAAGNIYVVWGMNNARTNEFSIWMASSHDHGQNFYGPFQVNSGPGTAVLPWIAAGDNGRIDVTWYQTGAVGDPNTLTGNPPWNVMFGQSLNANSREPVFTVSKVSDHVIHNGQISTGGLFGSSDRSLLDFFQVAIGPDGLANVDFADNASSSLHIGYSRQTSGPFARTPVAVNCVLGAPIPIRVVSRKTHGTAGDFDVDLPLTPHGVECRNGQPGTNQHKVVFSFAVPVTVVSASISSGSGSVNSTTVSGNTVTVNLTAADAQKITIKLTGVNDGAGDAGDISWPMDILLGDTNADGNADGTDVSQTKAQSGNRASTSGSAFREDVNLDGFVDGTDVSLVKSRSGGHIPPP